MRPMSLTDAQMALGWWICHQDPDRSLRLGEMLLPMCARCTGIYLFLGICLWAGLLAGRPTGIRSLAVPAAAAAAGCGVLLVQWLGAQMGLWTSTPLNRILTGLLCGAGIGWLLHTAMGLRMMTGTRRPWTAGTFRPSCAVTRPAGRLRVSGSSTSTRRTSAPTPPCATATGSCSNP